MSQTAPTLADALPTAPSTATPSTFASLADAFVAALATFRTQLNNLATNAYNNAVDCFNNATAAAASAVAAAASAASAFATTGVAIWVTGTTYAAGDTRYSPTNYQTYRRKSGGAGSTDPASDSTNWALLGSTAWLRKTTTYTANSGDHIKASTTAGGWSLTFPASPADGDQIEVQDVDGTFTSNNLTILANGKKVMGDSTSLICDVRYSHLMFVYDSTLGDWRI